MTVVAWAAVLLGVVAVLGLSELTSSVRAVAHNLTCVAHQLGEIEHRIKYIPERVDGVAEEIGKACRIATDWRTALGRAGKGPL